MILISSKLGGDVTLSADQTTISNSVEVVDDLTVNLNGKKLLYSGKDWLFNVYDDSWDGYDSENNLEINDPNNKTILTIEGEGEISATGACIARAGEGGEIIINGGKHTASGATLYESIGGKIKISTGVFQSSLANPPYTLFQGDINNIYINGGSFYKWDPSQTYNDETNNFPYQENQKTGYLAKLDDPREFYEVSVEKDLSGIEVLWYNVKRKFLVDDATDLQDAFNQNTSTTIEINQTIDDKKLATINNGGEVTLNMNNNSYYSGTEGGYSINVLNH